MLTNAIITCCPRSLPAMTRDHGSPGWLVTTTAGDFATDLLVNCAGLHCDRVSEMAGLHPDLRIIPFRGEYFKIKAERQFLVRNLIYPVPDPKFPFLGVHFTRLIHGGIEAGPNAVLAFRHDDLVACPFERPPTVTIPLPKRRTR